MVGEIQESSDEVAKFSLDNDGEVVDEKEVKDSQSEEAPETQKDFQSQIETSQSKEVDSEAEQYSIKVQERIDALVRQRGEAQKNEAIAIEMGQYAIAENTELKKRIEGVDSGYVSEAEERVKSQIAQTEQAFKVAIENEDVDGQLAATRMLTKLGVDEERVKIAKRRISNKPPVQDIPPPQQQQYQPPPPVASDRAIEWADSNKWFSNDVPMTEAAYAFDNQLISEGVDPNSEEYYTKLDGRLMEAFPSFYGANTRNGANEGSGRKPSRAVAPVGSPRRPAGTKPRTVTLNERELVMAKKLCPSTDPKVLDNFIKRYAKEKAALVVEREELSNV